MTLRGHPRPGNDDGGDGSYHGDECPLCDGEITDLANHLPNCPER